jgi:putative heme-binding domain-containing protein
MKQIAVVLLTLSSPAFGQLGRTGPPNTANVLALDAKAVEAGEALFQQLCTGCHGRGGGGGQGEGQGPNLVNSWEVRRASDKDLTGFIRQGVKGTAMPAFPLPDEQIRELAAYVRSLNAPANVVPVVGDVKAGEIVFRGEAGCSGCHMIHGRGGYLGPDLTDIGSTRRLGELREAILDPGGLSADGYRPVTLHDANGNPLRGIVKHESNWASEVLDEKGGLHLLHGSQMKQAIPSPGHVGDQWMPGDYGQRLSKDDVQNLLAYLSKQSVRPPSFTPVRSNPYTENIH